MSANILLKENVGEVEVTADIFATCDLELKSLCIYTQTFYVSEDEFEHLIFLPQSGTTDWIIGIHDHGQLMECWDWNSALLTC